MSVGGMGGARSGSGSVRALGCPGSAVPQRFRLTTAVDVGRCLAAAVACGFDVAGDGALAGVAATAGSVLMTAEGIALIRYIYIDVVGFARGRSIEAQMLILADLARVVRGVVAAAQIDEQRVLYLPTGDGVCIALLELIEPFDLDVRMALSMLEQLQSLSRSQPDRERRFAVRIGLNENQDNLVVDIAGRRNVVGQGVNMAQRIMAAAAPFQMLLGASVQARLCQRSQYRNRLRPVRLTVKHGERLLCYAYHEPAPAGAAPVASDRQPSSAVDATAAVQLPAMPAAPGRPLREGRAGRGGYPAEPSFRIKPR